MVRIKTIDLFEVQAFWDLKKQLDQETKFMMFEPDERRENLSHTVSDMAHTDFLVGAYADDGRIVGYLAAERGKYRRLQYTAYIVVGILDEYQHQGIGGKFFEALNDWALEKGVKRLELTVMCHNFAAIALYQKHGFSIEGTRRAAMCVDGEFVDEFYMGKVLGEKIEATDNSVSADKAEEVEK